MRARILPFSLLLLLLLGTGASQLFLPGQVQRLPSSTGDHWASLESSKLCSFQGESFGQLNKKEFLEFSPQQLKCEGTHEDAVWVDRFVMPFWLPIIPLDIVKKSLSDLAFLFQINANMGRHYVHIYKDKGDISRPSSESVALPPELPEELEELHRELRQKEIERNKVELKDKRKTLLGKIKRWKKATEFPYVWERALEMGKDEMWSVEGERTFLFGPMLTAGFIMAESVSMWANFGGSILSLDFLFRGTYRVTVRRVLRNGQQNIQVMFQSLEQDGAGVGLMSKSLTSDIHYGTLVRDSSINLLAGAAMEMNRLDLLPLSVEGFLKKSKQSNFIVEFDTANPESRRLYNQVMDGDFREIDSSQEEFKGNAAKVVLGNSFKRKTQYSRGKVYIPFVYKGTRTCQEDQYSERLMTALGNDMYGVSQMNLVSDLCHSTYTGLLTDTFFGRSGRTAGFGAGRVTNVENANHGLIGTHHYSTSKVSQKLLNQYSLYFYNLGVDQIHQSFQEQLKIWRESGEQKLDLKFSFYLGRNLITKLFGVDRKFAKDAIERSFSVKIDKYSEHKVSPRITAAKKLYEAIQNTELLNLNFLSEEEFFVEAKKLIELFGSNDYTLEYALAINSILYNEINTAVANAQKDDFNFYLSLGSRTQRYSQNALAILESDIDSFNILFKKRFEELWGNREEREAHWFPVSSLTGKEGTISADILDEIAAGKRNESIVSYECDCLFANEDKKTKVSAVLTGIAFKGEVEGQLSPDSYGRAVNQCLRASSEFAYNKKSTFDDIHYIQVPLNSCKLKNVSLESKELALGMLKKYEKLNTQINEILSRETTCDKAMIFKKVPSGIRRALSAVIGGYGWRIRGGGFEEELEGIPFLDGNLATVTAGSLVSYISANSCEDFIAGVKSSLFLAPGGIPGWGECFDMGNDKIHWRGNHNDKYYHDFPCMTTRMNFATSMMASYLESKGYEFNQELAGQVPGMFYLITKNYDPELWKDIVKQHPERYKPFAINHRIGLSEFLTGMLYGYTLSDALLKGKNLDKGN